MSKTREWIPGGKVDPGRPPRFNAPEQDRKPMGARERRRAEARGRGRRRR